MSNSSHTAFSGIPYVSGTACAPLLTSDLELSFWGGVNPQTGVVIDRHHPLSGQCLKNKILALPGGRGSCSGSGVILEMLVNGNRPAAIIVSRPDDIITLGVLVAQELFNQSIPVVTLSGSDFAKLLDFKYAAISNGTLLCGNEPLSVDRNIIPSHAPTLKPVKLSKSDQSTLDGDHGQAAHIAMKIIIQMAQLVGATELMDVHQVHIDGCVYTGPASLKFAQKLCQMGGRVAVPTSLNSISVDYRHWQEQGVEQEFANQARSLADAYTGMGAQPTFTCAPYLLETAPKQGTQIAWAESNAVVFANSVLGARTMKYPDFLDACIALTGRAPLAGPHLDENRYATLHISISDIENVDDAFYPLLGYQVGKITGNRIAAIDGIAHLAPDLDDLKAFGAAFATVSSAPMFHIVGVTPEAPVLQDVIRQTDLVEKIDLALSDLLESWNISNRSSTEKTELVSLGNPHFSLAEFGKLAKLCQGKTAHKSVKMMITTSRDVAEKAKQEGFIDPITAYGAKIITDTCWCMIEEPVIPVTAQTIMTNSAKYAHYGPGITGKDVRFHNLSSCVEAASSGMVSKAVPSWLRLHE